MAEEKTWTFTLVTDDEVTLLLAELRRAQKVAEKEFDPFLSDVPAWSRSVWSTISQKLVGKFKTKKFEFTTPEMQTIYEVIRRCTPTRGKKGRATFGLLQARFFASGFRPVMHI